jgi:hypothetical protein
MILETLAYDLASLTANIICSGISELDDNRTLDGLVAVSN